MGTVTKTFKRETAWGCLAGLWLLVLVAMIAAFSGSDISQTVQLIEALAIPVFAFAAAAFGLDWHSKQCGKRGAPDGP